MNRPVISVDEWMRTLPAHESYANPWGRLIDPKAPVPQPACESSRKHILADEPDPLTGVPCNKAGPKPPAHAAPAPHVKKVPSASPAPAPAQIRSLPATPPGPTAYRVPAMTYAEAIKVRERARNKQPVSLDEITTANFVVALARGKTA